METATMSNTADTAAESWAVQFNSDWYSVRYRNGGTEVYRDGQGLLFLFRGRLSDEAIRVGIAAYDKGYEDGRESLTPEPR